MIFPYTIITYDTFLLFLWKYYKFDISKNRVGYFQLKIYKSINLLCYLVTSLNVFQKCNLKVCLARYEISTFILFFFGIRFLWCVVSAIIVWIGYYEIHWAEIIQNFTRPTGFRRNWILGVYKPNATAPKCLHTIFPVGRNEPVKIFNLYVHVVVCVPLIAQRTNLATFKPWRTYKWKQKRNAKLPALYERYFFRPIKRSWFDSWCGERATHAGNLSVSCRGRVLGVELSSFLFFFLKNRKHMAPPGWVTALGLVNFVFYDRSTAPNPHINIFTVEQM